MLGLENIGQTRKRDDRGRWLLLLAGAFVLLILFITAAAAEPERPVGGVKEREIIEEDSDIAGNSGYEQSRGDLWILSGPTSCKTGQTYSWRVTNTVFYNEEYEFFMCVKDGSYPNANTADVQYDVYGSSKTVYYTFYFPGTYVLFVDVYAYDYYCSTDCITITVKDNGENKVTRMIKEVAAEQKADNEYQTVKNLHDWVLDHCSYDKTYTWYSADSIFLLGTGVCNSYSRAFTLLLKEAGIESRRVTGYAFGDPSAGHAWNAVKINGKWYLFDLTWDDSGDTQDGFFRYLYFAVPEEVFSLEHTARKYVGGKVKCTSWTDNYFLYTGEWETYAADVLDDYTACQDFGLHRFWLNLPAFCTQEYDRAVLGTITAYEMNLNQYPDSSGRVLTGEFEYDKRMQVIVGKHNHLGTLQLPESLTAVSGELFTSSAATCIILPDGCTSIGSGAFDGMDLWEIRIPASVPYADLEEAFADDSERNSCILIITPEGSPAQQFAEDHLDQRVYWLSE